MSDIAVVTGGMGGLGEVICKDLAEEGYRVVTTYSMQNTRAKEWLHEMSEQGYQLHAFSCDVCDYRSCQNFVGCVEKKVGPISILVNNAGITKDVIFRKMTYADFDLVVKTNLYSVFSMSRCVIDAMLEVGWGRIVNVSSMNGEKGSFGQANYAASKAGMYGLTKSLALEVAKQGITVNAISPGYLATKMTSQIPQEIMDKRIMPYIPVGRLGKPEEIARLVTYLVSKDAAFITGANISINGGQHM